MNSENFTYTIVYGCSGDSDIEYIKNYLSDLLDIHFDKRSSDYLGSYYSHKGHFADSISIVENSDSYALNGFDRKYRFIISIVLSEGRKKDKISKYNFLKNVFAKKTELFHLIGDSSPQFPKRVTLRRMNA